MFWSELFAVLDTFGVAKVYAYTFFSVNLEYLAVIVAVPAFPAVTTPPLTDATLELLVLHVTVLLFALLGWTVAESISTWSFVNVTLFLFRVTPVGAGG